MAERKPIDPALRRFIDEQVAAWGAPVEMTDEARTRMLRERMVAALESRGSIPGLPNKVEIRDIKIADDLPARLYTPHGAPGPLPFLVYLHGGGWVAGSVATHDPFCRLLSGAAEVIVASIDFRSAPEHPYPAAVDDTLTAARWAAQHAAEYGGDATRLALGGDSAGANLAAVVANRLRGAGEARSLRALLLLYPVTDSPEAGHASYTENATGYGLEANLMRWFWRQYASGASPGNPDISPLQLHKLPALPPTLVATAEYDILRDEGVAYARKLEAAGIPVTRMHTPDMHHNFPVHPATVARFPQCDAALSRIASWLRATLA